MKTLWKLSVLLILSVSGRSAASQQDEMRLKEALFSNYDKTIAAETPLNLTVSSSLLKVVDVDADKGLMTTDLRFSYLWTDRRLAWDPKDYNITGNSLVVPREMIFLPDMEILNGFATELLSDPEVLVDPHGSLSYLLPVRVQTYCILPREPFGGHICQIRIGPWSRSTSRLNIWSFNVNEYDLWGGGRCTLEKSQTTVYRVRYVCCPEDYQTATLSLNITCCAKEARRLGCY